MANDLPAKVDVAVLGGGLAGLWLAHQLADHAEVLLVDEHDSRESHHTSSLGIAAVGQGDNPARLVAALGEDGSEQLWRWSRRAVSGLRGLCVELGVAISQEPVLRLALDPHEEVELRETAALIEKWEPERRALLVERGELSSGGLGDEFLVGLQVAGDMVVGQDSVRQELKRRLGGRASMVTGCASVGDSNAGGVVVAIDGVSVVAELVVVCCGARAATAHPAFKELVFPVRIHASQTEHDSGAQGRGRFQRGAGLARHRFEAWTWRPDGALSFAGCRWADGPDMGAGFLGESEHNPSVFDAHDGYVRRHLGVDRIRPDQTRRSCGVTAYTCDGLPLVGPLLGSPRVVAMVGWGGWGLSAIGAAVEDLTFALLGLSSPPPSPRDLLGPRRML